MATHQALNAAEKLPLDANLAADAQTATGLPRLGATCPDAAPRPLDTAIRVAIHALVLIAILVFLVWSCIIPAIRPLLTLYSPAGA